jgi:RHS repeat-associated protein
MEPQKPIKEDTPVRQAGEIPCSILDRLLTRTYSGDSTLNVSIQYDSARAGYHNAIGHIASLTDQAGSLSRSYDERGNITFNSRTLAGQLYSTGYTYESAGRLSGITYASSGWVLAYSRDTAGQITTVTTTQPGHGATNLATSVTHMPFGPVASLTWGNGVTDVRTFDLDYRMTSITDHGTANIQYLSYGYDADNNPTTITDIVTGGNTQTLTYDLIDRLKSATGVYGTISSITYDSNSNRLTYGATTYTTPGLSDRMSTAAGSAITYISTGNVNGIGANSMTYNQANQLKTAVVSGTTSTYTYDAFGIRNKIKTGTTPFQITQYDQWGNLLTETSAAATPVETDYAYLDGMPISAIQPAAATISALHTDNLGTVLRGSDSTKTIVYTANFNPNGAVTPTTTITQNLRLPGMHADSTGIYYDKNRYLDPVTLARFGQVDLLGASNPYVYGNNNLFKNIDPDGLSSIVFVPGNPNGTEGELVVVDDWQNVVGRFPAGNRVQRSAPAGQWPAGTYPYTDQITHTGGDNPLFADSNPNGYYGRYGIFVFDAPQCNHGGGCGVHAGRQDSGGPNHATNGCIRTTPDATGTIQNLDENGDLLTTLTVLPRMSYPPGYDPVLQMFPNSRSSPVAPAFTPAPLD